MRLDNLGFHKVWHRLKRFPREHRGVAAVEFTLIAPFMIALWLGATELSMGITIDRKVSLASSALADLVTQQTNVTSGGMDDIMDATTAIMMPYDVGGLSIEIAGVSVDDDGNTRVEWSETRNGTAPAIGGTYAIPPALLMPDTFLVVASLSYEYLPPTAHVVSGPITLTDEFYLRPRRSDSITYTR